VLLILATTFILVLLGVFAVALTNLRLYTVYSQAGVMHSRTVFSLKFQIIMFISDYPLPRIHLPSYQLHLCGVQRWT